MNRELDVNSVELDALESDLVNSPTAHSVGVPRG